MGLDNAVPVTATAVAAVALVEVVRRKSFVKHSDDTNDDLKTLSIPVRQRLSIKERARIAKEEKAQCWMYSKEDKELVYEYFDIFSDPKWKLKQIKSDGTEVWKLPGEEVHKVMGVQSLDTNPDECYNLFKDPKFIFTKLFPIIDGMFMKGEILKTESDRKLLCHATFKMPMPVGDMPARGIRSRDFVWRQVVKKLSSGGMLVTAKSLLDPEIEKNKEAQVSTPKGMVRGQILCSGYYGRTAEGTKPNENKAKVWYIVQADPKGFLPNWLVNLASGKQADNVTRLNKYFKNKRTAGEAHA